MATINLSKITLQGIGTFLILLYPIMVIGYLPFGGGIRYYSVLIPVAILLLTTNLIKNNYPSFKNTPKSIWQLITPFTPFTPFIACAIVTSLYHDSIKTLNNINIQILYAFLLSILLSQQKINLSTIIKSNALACAAFFITSMYEIFLLDRSRAWGLVYENTFGQFSVLCTGICMIAMRKHSLTPKEKYLLISSIAMGTAAALMSGSRGALLPLICLFSYLFLNKKNISTIVTCAALILIPAAIATTKSMERIRLLFLETANYISHGEFMNSSIGIRLELWKISLKSLSTDHPYGFGSIPFIQLGEKIPEIKNSTDYMHQYFSGGGNSLPWMLHGDIPQIIIIGGPLLLLGFIISAIFLYKQYNKNAFQTWVLFCAFIWGWSELIIFNRISFGLILINLVLFSPSAWKKYHSTRLNDTH
ncbi:hypothetical protein LH452_08315 [Laribacter hongkongensis]|uniref:O-antigen ligase family protein n=1 Tax=Laribacter hongkongensis TaxID=168471 RepID=UPI001EFD2CD7|nr:O-antigen ligase family protein [Laribacter hongkongensis]MCG9058947.1 hypothetical protein [Laribacter hongkongensis]MCG9085382.1 hypothetical protein [Laribacter hongkongensis]